MLELPLPGEETKSTPAQVEDEGASFMAAMTQHAELKGS